MVGEEAAVAAVLLRYGSSLDERRWDRLESCFVPEVGWSFGGSDVEHGRDSLVAICRAAIEAYDATQHVITNREAEVEGGSASLRANLVATHVRDDARFVIGGVYRESMVRVDDGWRIASHRLDILWTEGQP